MLDLLPLPQNILVFIPLVLLIIIPKLGKLFFFIRVNTSTSSNEKKSNRKAVDKKRSSKDRKRSKQEIEPAVLINVGNERQRVVDFDFMKGIGIIAVLVIHVMHVYGGYTDLYNPENNYFIINNIGNNVMRFTICWFILSSGILLKPIKFSKVDLIDFYFRKVLRILPPFFLMCFIIDYGKPLSDVFSNMVTGATDVPYYFVIVLFECYLLYPLLLKLEKFKYAVLTVFIVSLISYVIPDLWYINGVPVCLRYLFFFAYGVYNRKYFLNFSAESTLRETALSQNKWPLYFWISLIVYFNIFTIVYSERYYNTCFFYGIAAFHLFFYFKHKINFQNIFNRFLTYLGKISLWIFLTHFQIMLLVEKELNANYSQMNFYLRHLVFFIISFTITIIVSSLMDKLYVLITKPLMRLINKKREERKNDREDLKLAA